MYLSARRYATIASLLLTSYLVDASPFFVKRNDTSLYHAAGTGSSGFVNITSTVTDVSTATTASSQATATSSASADQSFNPSQPHLAPAVHPNQPTDQLENLTPVTQQSLYYSSNAAAGSSSSHVFAEVTFNATYPCVVLLHSQFVQSIAFSQGAIDIKMSDAQALAYVESTWPASSPIMVAGLMQNQGQSAEQHTFWMANGVTVQKSDNSIHVFIQQELTIEEAMPEVELVWGTYHPTNASANSQNPATASSPITPSSDAINLTDVTCGAPPAPFIDGFPTATCGSPTFDSDIDRELGYLSFDAKNWSVSLSSFTPGLNGSDYSIGDNQDFGAVEPSKRLRLRPRGFFSSIVDGVRSAGNAVVNAGQAAVQGAVNAGQAVVQGAVNAGQAVAQGAANVAGEVTSAVSNALAITPTANAYIPINIGPALGSSPFGPAKQLFTRDARSRRTGGMGQVTVYCVQCGVHGDIRLSGSARYTIKDGLTQANAGLSGNVMAGLQIGIDATAEISQNSQFPLISTAVPPGFSVPGVFSIGPMVSLEADIQLDISLAGQVLAGATLSIPNFQANLDLVNSGRSGSSGFTPQFQKIFQANAAVTATLGLGLPLGVGLGISIPPIKLQKTAALYDKPSIGATATYTGSIGIGGNVGNVENVGGNPNCVNGISYSLTLGNDLYADIFGLAQVNILQYSQPVAANCISLGSSSDNSNGSGDATGDSSDDSGDDGGDDSGDDGGDDSGDQKRSVVSERNAQGVDPWAYIDSDAPNPAADNPGFRNLSNAAVQQANSEMTPSNSQPGFVDDPDITWTYINDPTKKWSLTADPASGNVYVADPGQGSLFAIKDGIMIGDVSGSCFHYYPDVMERYGVSRLRFANQTMIPKDANYVGLMGVTIDTKSNSTSTPAFAAAYAAFDTKQNAFLLATCNIQGQNSKLFLARDAETGLRVLQNETLRWTVTGGVVQNCFYQLWDALPLQAAS